MVNALAGTPSAALPLLSNFHRIAGLATLIGCAKLIALAKSQPNPSAVTFDGRLQS
jgi:hypothetical protein